MQNTLQYCLPASIDSFDSFMTIAIPPSHLIHSFIQTMNYCRFQKRQQLAISDCWMMHAHGCACAGVTYATRHPAKFPDPRLWPIRSAYISCSVMQQLTMINKIKPRI